MTISAHPIYVAILDDELSVRTSLVRLLESGEMVAHGCATSSELFDYVALKRPDCLLLDLQGREMNGLDVLKYLNQWDFRIPTIVITGSDDEVSREACMNAGAVAYLRKPLDPGQLVQMIEEIPS
jgi:two-component system nitrate/nitrite response regulator NarL